MTEQWKEVPGFPGYDVSDMGRVRSWRRNGPAKTLSVTPRILGEEIDRDGYRRVRLSRGGIACHRLVHRLVLEAFVGPCPPDHEARHMPNNDPADCRLANLSWAPHLTNIRDKYTHGTMPMGERHHSRTKPWCTRRGSACTQSRLTERQAREILRSTETQAALAARMGVSVSTVGKVRTGKNWKHVYDEIHGETNAATETR